MFSLLCYMIPLSLPCENASFCLRYQTWEFHSKDVKITDLHQCTFYGSLIVLLFFHSFADFTLYSFIHVILKKKKLFMVLGTQIIIFISINYSVGQG